MAAELLRRLPDVQVLVRLRSTGGGGAAAAAAAAGGGGGDKLAHLLKAGCCKLCDFMHRCSSTAADAVAHAERLLKSGAEGLAPLSRYHALMLLRERSTTTSPGGSGVSSGSDGGVDDAGGEDAATTALGGTAEASADTATLPPAADLSALLRLAISPQPAPLRTPLWEHIYDLLRRCAALHLATPSEPLAWLTAVVRDSDADALAATLHLCIGTVHGFVDRATELAAELATEGNVRLSPLATCALSQLTYLAASPAQTSVRATRYLCRALAGWRIATHRSLACSCRDCMRTACRKGLWRWTCAGRARLGALCQALRT